MDTDQARNSNNAQSKDKSGRQDPIEGGLRKCCQDTIDSHAMFNPMMLCQVCKHLIKCFENEAQFRNYQVFCASRGRAIETSSYQKYQVVVFRTYEPCRF